MLRTVASRLLSQDLVFLAMRGARPAGPPPAKAALPRRGGSTSPAAGQAVELDRKVQRDGHVLIDGSKYQVGTAWPTPPSPADGHLMHAIADGALAGTWPCPSPRSGQPSSPGPGTLPRPCPRHRCPPGPSPPPAGARQGSVGRQRHQPMPRVRPHGAEGPRRQAGHVTRFQTHRVGIARGLWHMAGSGVEAEDEGALILARSACQS